MLCVFLKGGKHCRGTRLEGWGGNQKSEAKFLLNADGKKNFAFGYCSSPSDIHKPVVGPLENGQQGSVAITLMIPGTSCQYSS